MLLAESLLGSSSAETVYIEDVFSTWLYSGNSTGAGSGATQTFNTGIDLAGKGGLVWIKDRVGSGNWHALIDTARGANQTLYSNTTNAQQLSPGGGTVSSFNNNGFTVGSSDYVNQDGRPFVSWTFRKQPKFFDIVTYTGNGANRTIAHNLGSVPGCIIVKRTDASADWQVYHRSVQSTPASSADYSMQLNLTTMASISSVWGGGTPPTGTTFTVSSDATVNANGGTYVAYLFAHDAGGFGATGADNVISCGSYVGNGSATGPVVTLGYEPQFVIIKRATSPDNWNMYDVMRGIPTTTGNTLSRLRANTADAEGTDDHIYVTSTGFQIRTGGTQVNGSGDTYIYIAIRRGPMRTPTSGASVFNPVVYTGTNVDNRLVDTTIAPDMVWVRQRNDPVLLGMVVGDRLRAQPYLLTGSSAAEVNDADAFDAQLVNAVEYGTAFSAMNGFWCGNDATAKLNANTSPNNHVAEAFRRAPGFFDIVCDTGTSSGGSPASKTVSHNLGVKPELILRKRRGSVGGNWLVYASSSGFDTVFTLNTSDQATVDPTYWSAEPTASVFSVGTNGGINDSGSTYVTYLFASCPGVSKVGSYTGTGATQTINCGFSSGARFVLIKRTDSTGDWYVWDSARGIVAGNDPYLVLNSTAAEVTNTDWVDTAASGFELSNAAGNLVNINGASYIFLAIA